MKKRNLIISSILAAGMLTAGGAHAYGGGKGEFCDKHPRGGARAERMDYMMDRLDMSSQQRDAVYKIREEEEKKVAAKRDELRKLREAMREQSRAEKYDDAKVRELADAQAKIMSDIMVIHAESMKRMRDQLSADQEARVKQMKEQMKARREQRGYPERPY